MLVSDFDFHLPDELIAKEPLADRAASHMLHLDRRTGAFKDRMFRELPDMLRPDDLLVFNNSRVFPARLFGRRGGLHAQPLSAHNPAMKDFLHGRVEVLLTKRVAVDDAALPATHYPLTEVWNALVRPGRKIDVGEYLYFGENDELRAEVIARGEFGERTLRFDPVPDFFAAVERLGHVPLPPYIHRPDRPEDRERYQTVYARERGSVAAPTAGLHFTPEIIDRIRARGIETVEITLHVGLGTFQPVHVAVVEEHKLHREWYSISEDAATAINRALARDRRIVAVGTTTVRTLEYAALLAASRVTPVPSSAGPGSLAPPSPATGSSGISKNAGAAPLSRSDRVRYEPSHNHIHPGSGEADIFIYPGFRFHLVSAMLTNFHLPQSTLLMLVSALAGRERLLAAYKHAVERRYRFFSYGDCMFIE